MIFFLNNGMQITFLHSTFLKFSTQRLLKPKNTLKPSASLTSTSAMVTGGSPVLFLLPTKVELPSITPIRPLLESRFGVPIAESIILPLRGRRRGGAPAAHE